MSHWRIQAATIIAKVLEDTKGRPEDERRKAVSAAYPFGIRKHHPYKIWLDEVKRQMRGPAPAIRTARHDLRKLEQWESIYGKRSA
jgi:1,2-phenylacetyl-CoA epoxidase PaaB subunit